MGNLLRFPEEKKSPKKNRLVRKEQLEENETQNILKVGGSAWQLKWIKKEVKIQSRANEIFRMVGLRCLAKCHSKERVPFGNVSYKIVPLQGECWVEVDLDWSLVMGVLDPNWFGFAFYCRYVWVYIFSTTVYWGLGGWVISLGPVILWGYFLSHEM